MSKTFILLSLIQIILSISFAQQEKESTEYKGQKLTPLREQRTTHIEAPPKVDLRTYRLKVLGLVENPLELSYEQVLSFPQESRVITMNCVEGWGYTALWTGVRIADILEKARPKPEAKTVIFQTIGGEYNSSLPLEFIRERKILLACKINNITLSPQRGFPFMVAAEDKYGYKWVQWVEKIELYDKDFKGYWENRGFPDKADIRKK
jgi:DMSO/TMAO reductase YedYZ molybdopterin-dependent catalytic subunit